MKLPKINIKTEIWNKELPEFKEAIIALFWTILIITMITLTLNIFNQIGIAIITNTLIIAIVILMILSYNKHKKETRNKGERK